MADGAQAPPVSSCATARSRSRIDGKKTRGYSPFTLAAEISALLAAADIAELTGHADAAATLRDTADAWNDNIERWIYATGGDLARATRRGGLLRAHRSAGYRWRSVSNARLRAD